MDRLNRSVDYSLGKSSNKNKYLNASYSNLKVTVNPALTSNQKVNILGGILAKVYAQIELDESELCMILDEVLPIFKKESTLLDLNAPIVVCGDIHGQFYDLIRLFSRGGWPPQTRYLFLGDYVDRGSNSVEVLSMLLLFKCLFSNRIFLLRGNHESDATNRIYGFYDEFMSKYSARSYVQVHQVFAYLPIAALVNQRIFCVHGGLSPHLGNFDRLRNLKRPFLVRDNDIIVDLLWSDPEQYLEGWGSNKRGCGYTFGADVVHDFCRKLDIDLIIRAHQVVDNGFTFFAQNKMLTIFSAPNYCGVFSNAAAMVTIDHSLQCQLIQLKPTHFKKKKRII